MLSLHFNKQVFINTLKANNNAVVFLSTMFALMLTLVLQGTIQGTLKLEYFAYALAATLAFYVWAFIDTKYRTQKLSDQEAHLD
ncbi:hypothetical protein [Acinetobacter sp. YH12239]|uniref:hypothetical protein n=1 Tax=Acinetobacter sp. YH12239 TaxID=2601166 RepID=UPI0015D1DDA5|nr:hypothetical protein [Acinetobacter sp. YH12239]